MSESHDPSADSSQLWEERLFGLPCPVPKDDPRYRDWLYLAGLIAEVDEHLKMKLLEPYKEGADPIDRGVEFMSGRVDVIGALMLAVTSDYEGIGTLNDTLSTACKGFLSSVTAATFPRSINKPLLLSEMQRRFNQRRAYWTAEAVRKARRGAENTLQSTTDQGHAEAVPGPRDQDADHKVAGSANGFPTPLGRNIDRFRRECGWSYDELSEASKIAKKSILRHVNEGTGAYPSTVKAYADAFSKRLGRTITVHDLNG